VTQGYDIALLLRSIGQDVYRSPPTSTADIYHRRLPQMSTEVYRRRLLILTIPTTPSRMCAKVFSPARVCHSHIEEVCSYFLSCRNALATYPEGNLYPSPPHIVTNISVVWSRLKRKHDNSRRTATGLTSRYPGSAHPCMCLRFIVGRAERHLYSCHSDVTLFTAPTLCCSRF